MAIALGKCAVAVVAAELGEGGPRPERWRVFVIAPHVRPRLGTDRAQTATTPKLQEYPSALGRLSQPNDRAVGVFDAGDEQSVGDVGNLLYDRAAGGH